MSDIKRLQMLVELGRLGTISAVARSLAYSTSAVSQQLAQLERDFGASLIEPDGRRVRLTPQGEVLLGHAEDVLREWEGAHSAVSASADEVSGSVSISAFETACLALIPPLVRDLTVEHPGARLTVQQADSEAARELVVSRGADIGIVERYLGQTFRHSGEIVETVLFTDRMLLAVPENIDREVRGLEDVADLDWVVELPAAPARSWAESMCRNAGFEPRVTFESFDVLVHHNLVRSGVAVGFMPELTPKHMISGVRLIDLGEDALRTVYTVSRESQQRMPLVRTIIEMLARHGE
ncbi:LysR family transcriptional regulator [Gulosibacter molinativorax]|uniref:LysR family transcriptional regulator n=1 Tax=Gulosibacter molinativorax TaxID=256821 RepID=A0ABT7C8E6_9MICO|nr:LysR family transcriptional regulator [Gulosibacter molinativorax]MDJ1371007.1 LysR family transcriptional regulator [Gulosibacter molinativorax]QUY62801.1 Transcriptional regulator, LysR family [Gulosibacter molinativorax]